MKTTLNKTNIILISIILLSLISSTFLGMKLAILLCLLLFLIYLIITKHYFIIAASAETFHLFKPYKTHYYTYSFCIARNIIKCYNNIKINSFNGNACVRR